jgi:hypothetical protein
VDAAALMLPEGGFQGIWGVSENTGSPHSTGG